MSLLFFLLILTIYPAYQQKRHKAKQKFQDVKKHNQLISNNKTLEKLKKVKHEVKREEFVPPPPPDFQQLNLKEHSKLHLNAQFIEACSLMAGYYQDPMKNPDLNKTIVMVGINIGYKDFFHNFKCFMDRLGIKFLPIALDDKIYKYLVDNKLDPVVLLGDIPGRDQVTYKPATFGGKDFNLIGCRKIEAVGAALSLGYDVVFSDVDVAVLRDPLSDLFLPGVDYVHSTNKGCNGGWDFWETMEGNTGFYAVKSNPETIKVWDLTYRACAQTPQYDDQTMFWLILRHSTAPTPHPLKTCPSLSNTTTQLRGKDWLVSCPLDDCLYSASQLATLGRTQELLRAMRARRQKVVMIHANWISGHTAKKRALVAAGLWITKGGTKPDEPKRIRTTFLAARETEPERSDWTCAKQLKSAFV